MKKLHSYLAVIAMGLLAFTSCQNDFDEPAVTWPESSWKANTTIADLKTQYWDDATNYINTIKPLADGTHVIISGRVISSDASGNIYKSLVIQDETAALAFSIDANSLYNTYRVGQEVLIDVTGMYIGKYNGLQQLGFPEWYAAGNAWEATFMPLEYFKEHVQLNGAPDMTKIKTLTISGSDIASTTSENLIRYQSQLVRFDNCYFEDGGVLDFTDGSQVTSNRNLVLADGTTIIVRTSGYSNFWDTLLPKGRGSVEGILSFYGTSGWQLLLRSIDDCIGFAEEEGGGSGTYDDPYDVNQVIIRESSGAGGAGWVGGYIVGAVKPGVSAVASSEDIDFGAASMPNTLVIAASADEKDYTKCLVIELPKDSDFRTYGNLVNNPGNLGKAIKVEGTFAKVLSTWGLTGNTGGKTQFWIDGVTIPDVTPDDPKPDDPVVPPTPGELSGDGTQGNPYTCLDVVALNNPGTEAWVQGYIVGFVAGTTISYATFGVPADRASNVLISDNPLETDASKCVPVELKSGSAVRKALNLMDNPRMLGTQVQLYGTLSKYMSVAGLRAPSEYVIM